MLVTGIEPVCRNGRGVNALPYAFQPAIRSTPSGASVQLQTLYQYERIRLRSVPPVRLRLPAPIQFGHTSEKQMEVLVGVNLLKPFYRKRLHSGLVPDPINPWLFGEFLVTQND